jgi:hypothetical protein
VISSRIELYSIVRESMSVSNHNASTIDDGTASRSSKFLDYCNTLRNNDPSILPEPGEPLWIRHLSEKEHIELADAFIEDTSVTYIELMPADSYTKSSADAMAKYLRTSKRLQRIYWHGQMRENEEIICCFLLAFQESTSLKMLHINFPVTDGGPSHLALENMLTNTQSLRSLKLCRPYDQLAETAVEAAVASGLKNNTIYESSRWNSRRMQRLSPLL